MSALVDVILPTHSRAKTLPFAIEAVLGQTHRELRLHVVGDGCPDATAAVAGSFPDPRVTFHRFPKGPGCGYAHRNAVLRDTGAPFVAYATDDDLWLPDHLESAVAELRGRELDLVAFRAAHVRPDGGVDPHFFAFDWRIGPVSSLLRRAFMGSAEYVHRRSVFERVGYWDQTLPRFGDRELYARILRSPAKSDYVDRVTVLRFYSDFWDPRYDEMTRPPQEPYLTRVRDEAWRTALRRATRTGRRDAGTRLRQAADCLRFGARSAPELLRLGRRVLWPRAPAFEGNGR